MQTAGYWQKKLTRRRVLAASAAGTGMLALTVVGCGSGGSDKQTVADKLGNVTQPKDTSKDAKRGGVLNWFVQNDEATMDPLASSRGAGFGGPSVGAFSRILKEKDSVGWPKAPSLVGDLAESWELSNGGLQLTVKLRQDAKFDPRAPTNSRVVDADDVVFSLNKLFAQSPYASQLSYKVDPAAPVESIQKIDNRTVVYKMAFPWAPLMSTFAHGAHLVLPREAESQFNPKNEVRGSSAWMLDKYEPSARFSWRKNPNWYRKDVPYLDGYDTPIITEPATRLAQFTAKAIDTYSPPAADVAALIQKFPELKLYEGDVPSTNLNMAFGSKPGSPFYDVRVRRAFSMLVDRELLGKVSTGADQYEKYGIALPYGLDTSLSSSWAPTGYYLDPRDASKWGEAGQYWKHNPTAAKALLQAAGYQNGLEVVANQSNRGHGSQETAQIIAEMLAVGGVRVSINVVDYSTVFLPLMWVSGETKGNYDGFVFGSGIGQAHIASTLYINAHSKGSFTASRRWDDGQDKIDSMINAALKEFDENKLKEQVWETQRALASYMSGLNVSASAGSFRLTWPWIQNYGVFKNTLQSIDSGGSSVSAPPFLFNWIDPSLKPA